MPCRRIGPVVPVAVAGREVDGAVEEGPVVPVVVVVPTPDERAVGRKNQRAEMK